jgi:hypothetical protein
MFLLYVYVGVCTAVCTVSVYLNYRILRKNGVWHYWYATLYEWVVGQSLTPPTPRPEDVENTPIPHETGW